MIGKRGGLDNASHTDTRPKSNSRKTQLYSNKILTYKAEGSEKQPGEILAKLDYNKKAMIFFLFNFAVGLPYSQTKYFYRPTRSTSGKLCAGKVICLYCSLDVYS